MTEDCALALFNEVDVFGCVSLSEDQRVLLNPLQLGARNNREHIGEGVPALPETFQLSHEPVLGLELLVEVFPDVHIESGLVDHNQTSLLICFDRKRTFDVHLQLFFRSKYVRQVSKNFTRLEFAEKHLVLSLVLCLSLTRGYGLLQSCRALYLDILCCPLLTIPSTRLIGKMGTFIVAAQIEA